MNSANTTNSLSIRLACAGDIEGIRRVYEPYIRTPITFEEEVPAPAGFHAKMEQIMLFYPCLVVCSSTGPNPSTRPSSDSASGPGSSTSSDFASNPNSAASSNSNLGAGSDIVGFAYAHRQAERAAYDWNAELSIYLDARATRAGIGSALYQALIELLALQGIRTVYARVTLPNPASERLHARFGFECTWVQKNAGFRLGKWRNVAWFVKQINPYDEQPRRPVAFPELLKESPRRIEKIIEKAAL